MKNYKMIITYDGTRYYGWEHQPTTDMTIQGKLESVLSAMTGTEVEVIGAGRTDAGVHAKGMVANAHMETKMKEDEICDYMNRYLPEDICVQEVRVASDRFHSRQSHRGIHPSRYLHPLPLHPIRGTRQWCTQSTYWPA